ncbi:MAG: hypothetical protein EBR01_01955 [Proteobacteria bacterium]|nr:hypothetical protein [Pseudomonadota bacterium]
MTQNGVFRCRQMLLVTLLVAAFLSSVSSADTLELLRKIPHSGYSEGLDFHNGFLWNALPKQILKIDPKDGTVVSRLTPSSDYSESLTWFNGVMWNLSFSDNGIYKGTLTSRGAIEFHRKGTTPEAHGWGIAHNGKHLIITGDYSSKLYFIDPSNLKIVRTLQTQGKDLEDLAWDGQFIWCSSFTTERGKIFALDPSNGKILGTFALPDDSCPIVDGIAFDGKGLWITGKECPSIYYVKKPTLRSITSKKGT